MRPIAGAMVILTRSLTTGFSGATYPIAAAYVGLKDEHQAFIWLNKAFQDRADWLVNLKVDPRFESLRSDPTIYRTVAANELVNGRFPRG
jgi:hypothetical protein